MCSQDYLRIYCAAQAGLGVLAILLSQLPRAEVTGDNSVTEVDFQDDFGLLFMS